MKKRRQPSAVQVIAVPENVPVFLFIFMVIIHYILTFAFIYSIIYFEYLPSGVYHAGNE